LRKKYPLRDEPGKTLFIFEKNGKFYAHVVKDRTDKTAAKIVFETGKYDSIDEIEKEFPPVTE